MLTVLSALYKSGASFFYKKKLREKIILQLDIFAKKKGTR